MIYQRVLIRHLQHNEPALTLQAVKTKESTSRDQCCCCALRGRETFAERARLTLMNFYKLRFYLSLSLLHERGMRSSECAHTHKHTAQQHLSARHKCHAFPNWIVLKITNVCVIRIHDRTENKRTHDLEHMVKM